MSLLSACVQPNPPNYYFELDTQPTNLVTSVSAGQYISVNNTNPAVPVVSSTLVAGTGVAIASGVLNAISASTASTFTVSTTAPVVDLESIAAVNVMTIPVPASAQKAKVFKVHMSGGFQYSSPAGPAVTMKAYCSTISGANTNASGDTLVNVDMNAVTNFVWGQPAMYITGSGGSGTWTSNEFVFLVQNAAAGTVSNLYFIMIANPNDGSQGIGVLNNVNLTATVEAFL